MKHTTSTSKFLKLYLFYSFYCYTTLINLSPVDTLLYHQFQPSPLLSRYSRQPQQTVYGNYNGNQFDTFGCPVECHCNEIAQIADCSNRNLTRVPSNFPKDIKRIRLERNNITEIGPYAFRGLRRLQRIDLSNNNLQRIDALAFSGGLESLVSLILYSNKLEYLPANLFTELSQLQLLLLNANILQTIHKDLFQDLTNLNLLSLYDNNIGTLPLGAFDGLKSIKAIHLGKNPLNCDCNLRWLAEFLETNRVVETSEARCETPRNPRIQGKKLSQLNRSEFKCSEQPPPPPAAAETSKLPQIDSGACPIGCICTGITVDCSRAGSSASQEHRAHEEAPSQAPGGLYELPDIPDDVPVYVARVHINDQRIKRIRQTGLFRRLANSQKLDLGNNRIVDIEDNALNGQFANGQRPERVVFVLLENKHCPSLPGSTVEGPPVPVDACSSAPKVNDPHFDSPCYNGGQCRSAQMGPNSSSLNYTCTCPPGFAGPLCEINIDDCQEHQCQNGALCVDGVNSYRCVCRDPTTSGEFCEQLAASSSAPVSLSGLPFAATSSAALSTLPLVAPPLALPIISNRNAQQVVSSNELQSGQQQQQQQQILARSADFVRAMPTSNEIKEPTGKLNTVQDIKTQAGGGCQRITQRRYFDDGNGCQSVRLLKLSTCFGSCSGKTCCRPTRVKRRRLRMQCSDGASYVTSVDLVKKCSCTSEDTCSALSNPFTSPNEALSQDGSKIKSSSSQYYKYLSSGSTAAAAAVTAAAEVAQKSDRHQYPFQFEGNSTSGGHDNDQTMQITRLDAVD